LLNYLRLRQPLTMAVSAYWHGLHAGYYLSMLTTTPCIIAEKMMERGLKARLSIRYHKLFDLFTWFFRCRAFDYMSLGFILLRYDLTIRYWSSVYFVGHLTSIFFICLGYALIRIGK
jgi:lysophospholipid acyltransferase 7